MNAERAPATQEATEELFAFLVRGQYREGGYAPLNAEKTMLGIYDGLREKGAFIVRGEGGGLIGTIGMVRFDYWYSDWYFLSNRWFYVQPAHRFGKVGLALIRAARGHAAAAKQVDGSVGVTAFVVIDSPDRRPKNTQASLFAQIAGYVPLGHVMKIR